MEVFMTESTAAAKSPPAMIGVLTGDVIGSSHVRPNQRSRFARLLKQALGNRSLRDVSGRRLGQSQVFRGDSFQLSVLAPQYSLATACHIICFLKHAGPPLGLSQGARIAIGIGPLEQSVPKRKQAAASTVGLVDGAAYRSSGQLLDQMKASRRQIAVETPWEHINQELAVECRLLDTIIEGWSPSQAAALIGALGRRTQEEIADQERISQSAVAQRLQRAHASALNATLKRFEDLIRGNIS